MTNREAIRYLKTWRITGDRSHEALDMAISALQGQDSPKPTAESVQNVQNEDLILRKAAIDAVDSETVSTNPENFKSSKKFIKFMDDADIASFGKWQWANGFNTALVATTIQLKKLPSAQPETAKRIVGKSRNGMTLWYQCDMCNEPVDAQDNFCRGCGRRLTDG